MLAHLDRPGTGRILTGNHHRHPRDAEFCEVGTGAAVRRPDIRKPPGVALVEVGRAPKLFAQVITRIVTDKGGVIVVTLGGKTNRCPATASRRKIRSLLPPNKIAALGKRGAAAVIGAT
jgi:hypothetical protein